MKYPGISVVTIVSNNKGEILMVKRRKPPFANRWSLPGGHLEFGEDLENAAKREVLEETGLIVEIIRLIDFKNKIMMDNGKMYHYIIFCFEGKAKSGKLSSGDDVKEVAWVNPKNIEISQLSPAIIDFIKHLI